MPSTHSFEPKLEPEHTSSFDESEDDVIPTFGETVTSSRKNNNYWIINVIDEDDTIKKGRLKVQDIWSLPTSKKVIVTCNELGHPINDAGGLLGGLLGDLGSDCSKFPMCYVSWCKVPSTYKEKVYDDIIKKKFHIEDSRLKGYIMKNIGKK